MAEPICPTCGCTVTDKSYKKEGVLYCCEACATSGECECGCCSIVEETEE